MQLDGIREKVVEEMRKIYTETTIDHAMTPRNMGSLSDSDGYARISSDCGDTMEVWLKVRDNVINRINFWTDACAATVAAGSVLTGLAEGKSILEAIKINQYDVLYALGGLPEGNTHSALLAANALKAAVRDYLVYQREPWKKAYRQRWNMV